MDRTEDTRRESTVAAKHGDGRQYRAENRSSEEILRDISHTRSNMDATLDELYRRLHPMHLLNDVLGFAQRSETKGRARSAAHRGRESARRAGKRASESVERAAEAAGERASHWSQQLWHEVRENPLPLVLMAAGVAMYVVNKRRDTGEEEELAEVIYEEDLLGEEHVPYEHDVLEGGYPAAHPAPAGEQPEVAPSRTSGEGLPAQEGHTDVEEAARNYMRATSGEGGPERPGRRPENP